jgi:hypothetical protein
MDPVLIAQLALAAINAALNIINGLKASGGLTGDQLATLADQQDAANAAQLKQLLATTPAPAVVAPKKV